VSFFATLDLGDWKPFPFCVLSPAGPFLGAPPFGVEVRKYLRLPLSPVVLPPKEPLALDFDIFVPPFFDPLPSHPLAKFFGPEWFFFVELSPGLSLI